MKNPVGPSPWVFSMKPEWNRLWAVYRDGTPSLLRDCEIPLALQP
jgi:hypothetical protein